MELQRIARTPPSAVMRPASRSAQALTFLPTAITRATLSLRGDVGSCDDLAGPANTALFSAGDVASLQTALLRLAAVNDDVLAQAQSESVRLAQSHGPAIFSSRIVQIARFLSEGRPINSQ